ncbi:gap junction Cx32.2 protein [Brachyhypopomus gauderio]|uniref:gap junction Cx32.2 protein n=1 Tax=Brachyhypopomus gauderio TaxID=698409 RepID=UPI004041042D
MGDWGFLSSLLDKVQSHSTVIGKIWMSVLFIFRILVLTTAAESVWGDERSEMVCNSNTPGCENVCYDWMFPISHMRFWVMQIIFVSTPTLLYLGHAVHVIHQENKLRQMQKISHSVKSPKYTDENGKVQIKGRLLGSYLAQLFFKILLELAFIIGQYFLYGFVMEPIFHCDMKPCRIKTECFMSRPREKTIFIIFMLVVACVSLALNVLEVFYLLCRRVSRRSKPDVVVHYSANAHYGPFTSVSGLEMEESLKQNHMNKSTENEWSQKSQ